MVGQSETEHIIGAEQVSDLFSESNSRHNSKTQNLRESGVLERPPLD